MFIANMMHIYPDERSINNSVKIALKAMKALGNKKIKLKKSNSLSGLIGFDWSASFWKENDFKLTS